MRAPAILFAFAIGCGSTSHKVDYRNVVAEIEATGAASVAVAVLDQRAVLSEGRKATYAGESNTAAGIPIRVHTRSGRPLAEDFNFAICATLEQRGFACKPITTDAHEPEADVTKQLIETKADKTLLLKLHTWRSRTVLKTTLFYNVTLLALDAAGETIATVTRSGQTVIEADDPIRPLDAIANKVPSAFQAQLEALLNDKDVVATLSAPVTKPDAKKEDSPFD